jgi:hypothetical protein
MPFPELYARSSFGAFATTPTRENAAGPAGFVHVDGWLLVLIVICSGQNLQQ